MNSNVLISGSDGFIGANFIDYLLRTWDKGNEVFALRRRIKDPYLSPLFLSKNEQRVRSRFADLTDAEELKRIVIKDEIDTICHFGAQSIVKFAQKDPTATFLANTMGTMNIMEAARIGDVKRVYIMSSDKVYGDEPSPYTEDTNLGSNMGIYDASKATAEIIARSYMSTYGLSVGVGRACNIYGQLDLNFTRVIPGVIKEILTSGQYRVFIPDNHVQVREFIHVNDLCRAVNLITEAGGDEVYNIGSDEITNISELKDQIANAIGFGYRVEVDNDRGFREIANQSINDSKIRSVLEFENKFCLETGLQDIIPWYVDYIKNRWNLT